MNSDFYRHCDWHAWFNIKTGNIAVSLEVSRKLEMFSFSRACRLNQSLALHLKRPCSSVPKTPVSGRLRPNENQIKTRIDSATIEHLERLSLVDFGNQEGIRRLEEAIAFADQILDVDTKDVEPLISVVHEECVPVREDEVTDGFIRDQILANAAITEEEYFTAPVANIPLPEKN